MTKAHTANKIAASNFDLQAAPLAAEPLSQRPNSDLLALMNVVTGINAHRAHVVSTTATPA
eukprot:6190974-Pleurochrysis_carterae.AAC.1